MKILAIDPGLGTGYATYETDTGAFSSGEVFEFIPACKKIEELLADGVEVCVAENFIITAKTAQLTQQSDALRLLGVIENECDKRGIPFNLHAPKSPNKPKVKNLLRVLGWFVKTKDDHANSAAYHLYCYVSGHNLLHMTTKVRLTNMLEGK